MNINKKGLTLVELMTTLALSSIILLAIGVGLQSFAGQYKSARLHMDAKNVATLADEAIKNSVRLSKEALICTNADSLGRNMIISRNGRLFKTILGKAEDTLISENSYSKLNCNVVFSKKDNNTLHYNIIIYSGTATATSLDAPTGVLYTLSRDVRLINTYDKERKFGSSGDIISEASPNETSSQLRYTAPS